MSNIKIINTCKVCGKIIKEDESYYQCEECKEYFHNDCEKPVSEFWELCLECRKNDSEYLRMLLKDAARLLEKHNCGNCVLKDKNCRPYECDIVNLKRDIERMKL